MKSWSGTIQMKSTEKYFPLVLLNMLCKVVLTSVRVDEILKCDHSADSYVQGSAFLQQSGTLALALGLEKFHFRTNY